MLKVLRIVLVISVILFAYTYYQSSIRVQVKKEIYDYYNIGSYQGSNLEGRIYTPIVRLTMSDGERSGFCSGTVIDDKYVLTAAHCVVGNWQFMLETPIEVTDITLRHRVEAKAVVLDIERDVALVQGDFSKFKRYQVDFTGQFMRKAGVTPFVSCGFPGGQYELYCNPLRYAGNYFFRMATTGGPIFRGCSGGPVFDDTGKVVGVNSAVGSNNIIIGTLTGFLQEF